MSDGCDPPKWPWLMVSACLERLARKQHHCNKQGEQTRLFARSVEQVSNIAGNGPRAKLAIFKSLEIELGCLVSYDEPGRETARRPAERGYLVDGTFPGCQCHTN